MQINTLAKQLSTAIKQFYAKKYRMSTSLSSYQVTASKIFYFT